MLLGILVVMSVSGCTSLHGAPERLISPSDAKLLVKQYSMENSLVELKKPGINKESYRNDFIYAYLSGYDASYAEFKRRLGADDRALGIGFDGALAGVTGLSTLIEESASDLAALTQALVSTEASLDRELLSDKTIPALIAAMDGDRLRVRTLIESKKSLTITEYPFGEALADLIAYQDAGTLESAVATLTDEATEQRLEARKGYVRARYKCEPIAALQPRLIKIRNFIGAKLIIVQDPAANAVQKADAEKVLREMAAKSFGIEGAAVDPLTTVVPDMARSLVGDGKSKIFCSEAEIGGLEESLKTYGFVP